MNYEEQTQQVAPEHQVAVGEASFDDQSNALAILVGHSGINCTWSLTPDKPNLSWTFGRGIKSDFKFSPDKKRLSSVHFRLWATTDNPPTIMLQDMSTNGTLLNHVRVTKGRNCMVMNGDIITVGSGVPQDEIRLIVSIPKTSRAAPQGGVYDLYDFGELVGQGAFALVRQAVKRETGERVAVKIIDKAKITGNLESAVEREIEILKRLVHPNIVTLHDIFIDQKHYYLVMDFVPHGDLMDYLLNVQTKEKPGLPEEMCKDIIKQVLEAVGYVHNMGISHRDLKPDNILINSFDPVSVKVADFGLAKLQAQGTFLKTFCGTLSYLAPEVLSTRPSAGGNTQTQTPRSGVYTRLVDIWSIGCMAYVILTGCMPFGGATQEDLYKSTLSGQYYEQPLIDAQVSEEGKAFIRYLLDINTETRPQAEQALDHQWFTGIESASTGQSASLDYLHQSTPASLNGNDGHSNVSSLSNYSQLPPHIRSSIPGLADLKLQSEWRQSRILSLHGNSNGGDGNNDGDDSAERTAVNDSLDDLSDMDTCEKLGNKMNSANQYRDPSQQIDPRDYVDNDNDEASQLPEGAWGGLETCSNSLPCKDLFFTKPTFSIGRSVRQLDSKWAYNGPLIDFAYDDKRLSKLHCMFEKCLDTNQSKKYRVYLNAYRLCYVNKVAVQPNTRVEIYNGDKITLFAEPKGKTIEALMFMFNVFGSDFRLLARPSSEKRVLNSTSIPAPCGVEPSVPNKRHHSEELGPSTKKLNTVHE